MLILPLSQPLFSSHVYQSFTMLSASLWCWIMLEQRDQFRPNFQRLLGWLQVTTGWLAQLPSPHRHRLGSNLYLLPGGHLLCGHWCYRVVLYHFGKQLTSRIQFYFFGFFKLFSLKQIVQSLHYSSLSFVDAVSNCATDMTKWSADHSYQKITKYLLVLLLR